ncbi:MAG: PKD domain-containing protein [bacterium]
MILLFVLLALGFVACGDASNPSGLPETTNTLGIRHDSSNYAGPEKFAYYFTIPVYNATVITKIGWQFKGDPYNIHELLSSQDNNYTLVAELFNGLYYLNFGVYTIDKATGNLTWDFKTSEWFNNPNNPYRVVVEGEVFFGFSAVNGKVFPIPITEVPKLQADIKTDKATAKVNENIIFDGSGSTISDPNQWYISEYKWDFNDGVVTTGDVIEHYYSQVGTYKVTLTVTATDRQGQTQTATAEKAIEITMPDLPVIGKLIYTDDLIRISYSEEADGVYIYIFADLLATEGPQDSPFFSGNLAGENDKWVLIDAKFMDRNNRWAYVKHRFYGNQKFRFNYAASYTGYYYRADNNWLIVDGANWNHIPRVKPVSYNGDHLSVWVINNRIEAVGF